MFEIVADTMIAAALQRALQAAGLAELSGVAIQLEMSGQGARRISLSGLDVAVKRVKTGVPTIMFSFLSWTTAIDPLADDPCFQAVMSMPNARFLRLPFSKAQFCDAIREAQTPDTARVSDPLAWRLVEVPMQDNPHGRLSHDLKYAVADAAKMRAWLDLARKVFGAGKSQDELITLVQSAEPETGFQPFAGESFPDVCVDVEDTLFRGDELNAELVAMLEQEAKFRPVTIWTGGDLKELSKKLRAAGLRWKLASKHWMRGASVARAYDDEPRADFVAKYGVTAGEYIQI